MIKEQENMQSIRFVDICTDSLGVIYYKKIHMQITLAFIIPLTFIFLAQTEASNILYTKFIPSESVIKETKASSPLQEQLSDLIFSKPSILWLIRFSYLTLFFPSLSLIPITAVVYTTACAYIDREITFNDITTAILNVWRQQSMTTHLYHMLYLAQFFILAVISFVTLFVLENVITRYDFEVNNRTGVYIVICMIYLSFDLWLSKIVSVPEDAYGFSDFITESRKLPHRGLKVECIIFWNFVAFAGFVYLIFEEYVHGESLNMASRVALGILCCLLLAMLILVVLVYQTVMCLCSSEHCGNIDKPAISRAPP